MRQNYPAAWTQAHDRLFQYLSRHGSEGPRPTLSELEPLYHALHHACLAKRFDETTRTYNRQMLHSADEHFS